MKDGTVSEGRQREVPGGLPDSRVRNRQPRLIKAADNVYSGHGYSVSNTLYVVTANSVVVIDTMESVTAARMSLEDFRHVTALPVSHIIYTHFHGDHIRGATAFHSPGTSILAHRLMPEELARNNMLLPLRERVNSIQLGTPMPACEGATPLNDPEDGYLPPSVLVDDGFQFDQGGEEFELLHAPGETVDHLAVWLPRRRVLMCGDLFYRAFPMLSNPFKPDRPVRQWIDSLERLRALKAECLVPSHGAPVLGAATVDDRLAQYARAIRHVYEETLRGIADGLSVEQLVARIWLPEELARLPFLQERYGTVRWAVRGIFRQHTGWYDSEPAHLNPGPRRALASAVVDAGGGASAFLQRAGSELALGHDQNVLELTDIVLGARPRHPRARSIRATALDRLASSAPNALERNIYRAAIAALRAGDPAGVRDQESQPASASSGCSGLSARHRSRQPDIGPLFVLAPPRSFTSVVGTMLGQHPQLYGLPETHLFGSETMAQWWAKCDAQTFPRADGLVRAVAELVFGGQTEDTVRSAIEWLKERTHYTTAMTHEILAVRAHPRGLVEKSPSIVYSIQFLERIRTAFPGARFLHLVRHPRTHGESVMRFLDEQRRRRTIPPSHWLIYLSTYPTLSPERESVAQPASELDPQKGWYVLNNNVRTFFETLSDDQKCMVRGEDILSAPDAALRNIAAWMGIRTDAAAIEAMKHPERSPYACYGPHGARYGNDEFFLRNPVLRPERAESPGLDGPLSWRRDGKELLPEVKRLAREFGYQ